MNKKMLTLRAVFALALAAAIMFSLVIPAFAAAEAPDAERYSQMSGSIQNMMTLLLPAVAVLVPISIGIFVAKLGKATSGKEEDQKKARDAAKVAGAILALVLLPMLLWAIIK